jgi:hypothetical protein
LIGIIYWQEWVDHNGDIPAIHILWQKNPPYYALQKEVVYADEQLVGGVSDVR